MLLGLVFAEPGAAREGATERGSGGRTTRGQLTNQRVMQTFDFEEREIHYDPEPMFWRKVTDREGFPHYSTGLLDTAHPRSGSYSFKLIPDGGSVGFQYDRRRILISPGSDFQVRGFVHLENAQSCRAQISCVLTNRIGRIIPQSRHRSRLVGIDDLDDNGWAALEVYLPGNFPQAKYLTVEVSVLQEEQWRHDALAASRIFRRDVNAIAWFDDIAIYQLPRVILSTDQPGNVFDGDQVARLQVVVEGITLLDYQINLRVSHVRGEVIRQESWMLTGIEGAANARSIELADLSAGLYRAELEIISTGTLIATRTLTFCKLAPLSGGAAASGRDFGIIALDEDVGDWDVALDLARRCNAKLIKLPVWRREAQQGGAIFSEKNFDQKLINLHRNHIEVIATFSEVPQSLAAKMEIAQRSLLDVLSQDVDFWRPQVAFVLAQYARQVPYWQIGADLGGPAQMWDPRIRYVIDTMRQEFNKLAGETVLAVPLSSMFQVDHAQIGTAYVALAVSSAIAPPYIPDYLDDFRQRGLDHIWAAIEPLDSQLYRRQDILIDLAKRIAYTKKGFAEAIFINHPWRQRQNNGRLVNEPTELMLVFRTLADHLGGSHYVGQFEIAPGIPALIFDRAGQGCLFTWNSNYDPQAQEPPPPLKLFLGGKPNQVDLFGNRKPLPTQRGISTFTLSQWPVLLTDIDSRIALLRASLEIEPDIVDATISKQELILSFVNPFSGPVSGRLRFLLDQPHNRNWSLDPVAINFSLQPGETLRQRLGLKFPRNEVGGKKSLDAFFTLDADRTYQFKSSIPFELRLAGIEVNLFTRRVGPSDLLIQQVITNESDEQVSLNCFVDLPDQDHLERVIPRLQSGASATRSFLIRDADQWLGESIRAGLYDPKGTKRINYHIEIN